MSGEVLLFGQEEPPPSRWQQLWRRWTPRQWLASLKVRVALGAVAVLVCAMTLTVARMSEMAQRQLLAQAQEREQAQALQLAGIVARRVERLQQALAAAAPEFREADRAVPGRLADRLSSQAVLRSMFSELALVDAHEGLETGVDAAGNPLALRTATDTAALKLALAQGQPVLSAPGDEGAPGRPMVEFLHPLTDGQSVWGVLVARLPLNSRDLLADLSAAAADDASVTIITDDRGRILAHPQGAMLLMNMEAEPRLATAAAAWRNSGRPLPQGADSLGAQDHVVGMAADPATGWHVWRVASARQLLAPMDNARRESAHTSLALAGVLAMLLVLMVAWQLRPLSLLERRAGHLLKGDGSDPWPEAEGEIGRLATTLRHVCAERSQADRFTADIMHKLMSVMSASPVGLAFVRHQRFDLISAECCRLLQHEQAALSGGPADAIFADDADFERFGCTSQAAFQAACSYEGEWRLKAADGTTFWARIHARPVLAGDAEAGSIWSMYNVDSQVAARQQLEHAASHDVLTGLLNRKAFVLHAAELHSAQGPRPPSSLVMIDLDRFKPVNDIGGHAAGDAMLKAIAQAISQAVRATDSVARIGGDEFALLLPWCSSEQALVVCEKVRLAVHAVVLPWQGQTFQVGASLGVATLLPAHCSVDEWLADADSACYAAKHAGRGAVRVAAATS